jgi:hypothetical protein
MQPTTQAVRKHARKKDSSGRFERKRFTRTFCTGCTTGQTRRLKQNLFSLLLIHNTQAVKPGCALSRYFFKEPAKFVTTVTEGLTCCATLSIRIFLPSGEMSKNTVGADVVIGICCGAPSCGAPSTSLNEIT